MRFLIFITAVLSLSLWAQSPSQPEKESTDDLRIGMIMFSMNSLVEGRQLWLERTPSEDYFLRMTNGKTEKILKLSSKEAKQMDMEFASKFLKSLYELSPTPEKCKTTLLLVMKGESQNICKEEDEKTREFVPFEAALYKRF